MKSNDELTGLLTDMEAAILSEAAANGIEATTWAEAVGEMARQLRDARVEAEVQDNCNQAIYATVERAIGRGCWHSQMEAVEDLAKRYVEAQEDSARLDDVDHLRFGILPGMPKDKHDYWLVRKFDGTYDQPLGKTIRAAIDAAREGK